MEVRTRVIRDQLGVKLAKEAGVNFDAPQIVADQSPPEQRQRERPRTERGPRETRGPKPAMQGRPDRGGRGAESRFERDAAPRRGPPQPSTPERRRKHVSALRAEIAADAADAANTRKRIERSATYDRKGRTIAVERMSRTDEEARTSDAAEMRPKRSERPRTGERGGRVFEGGARAGRSDSFGPKRGRAAGGREQPPHSDPREPGRRPERANAARGEGGPRERRFDRPAAKRDGDRRERPSGGADQARERKFDRPHGRTGARTGEGRPARSDDKGRGPRSDFKSRPPHTGARDGDRPQNSSRTPGGKGGPPRGRFSPGGRPPERKGPPKGAGGPRRPPRKP
jgi:23S rRNA pseudouridine2605 synthase